jgi:glutamate N-acetyltransferase/amino-acid N-acetyltransferase
METFNIANLKEIDSGVCAPHGFRAGGIWCGIKAGARKRDLALIYSEKACCAAGVFTTNRVKSPGVLVTRDHIAGGRLHAIIANSGNANACTGEAGMKAARRMADVAADEFAIPPRCVAVASTGVIGVPLPIAAIEAEVGSLADALRGDAAGSDAALEAIMTTDTRKKDCAVEFDLAGVRARIGGIAKGSGMIRPNMATMLCFITTDAAVSHEALDKALRRAVNRSFNRLTIDGDTSTNDMVLIMANGAAGNAPIAAEGGDFEAFATALEYVCVSLTKKMARDGEGADRLLEVRVRGAADDCAAETLARSVASSSLVKTAAAGADAKWGRVLCALGYAGVDFAPEAVSISFASAAGEVLVCENGAAVPFSEDDAKRILSREEIEIRVDIAGGGTGEAVLWGCDLTCAYVQINADYRT